MDQGAQTKRLLNDDRRAVLTKGSRLLALSAAIGVVLRTMAGGVHWTILPVMVAGLLAAAVPWLSKRLGTVAAASVLCGLIAGSSMAVATGSGAGIQTPIVLMLPVVPLLAGYLGGRRLSLVFFLVFLVCVGILASVTVDPQRLTLPFNQTMMAVALLIVGTTCTVLSNVVDRERTLALQAIESSSAQLQALFDNAPLPIFVKDAEGHYLRTNGAYREAFTEGRDVTGLSHREFAPDAAEAVVEPRDSQVTAGGVPATFEDSFLGSNGAQTFLTTLFPLVVGPEQRGLGGFILDVTERARAEEDLKRALADLQISNRELERFAYVASHDLQEPLRTVANFGELLARHHADRQDSRTQLYVGHVQQGVRRMQGLIEDLLLYARTGTRPLGPDPVDSGQIADEVLHDLHSAIRDAGATVARGSLPQLHVHPLELRQVLQNLIVNALKFRSTEDRPHRVRLHSRRTDNGWQLSVEDNGIGIHPEHAERVFEVFQRLHDRGEYEGTGIGLAICRKVVHARGGKIWVESEVGKGTTVHFTVPDAVPAVLSHADNQTLDPAGDETRRTG